MNRKTRNEVRAVALTYFNEGNAEMDEVWGWRECVALAVRELRDSCES